MNTVSTKRLTALLLAAAMTAGCALSLASCANGGETVSETQSAFVTEGMTEEEPDPFAGVNYKGREFRISSSAHEADAGVPTSNLLIQGAERTQENAGNAVNDAVYERNQVVEEKLGVKLVFTTTMWDYNEVVAGTRNLTASGTDDYDLFINDLMCCGPLSIEGIFRNVLSDECRFDFDKNYWYKDFMDDMRLMNGYEYMMAGDYFIDIIRTAHLLLYNKDMYAEYTQHDANEVYEWVENYEWTYERMNEMITGVYLDLNQNNKRDTGDRFGYSFINYYGDALGYVVSACTDIVTRDEDGIPTFTVGDSKRTPDLVNALIQIGSNEGASVGLTKADTVLQEFTEGKSLIGDYQRLGSLERIILRDMQDEMGVLPLPMLYASDRKYVTSAHDTTEVGAILATSTDLDYITTVIEVLNRETANILIPQYYSVSLQIQYVNDPYSSEMVGIIHDNFGGSFLLAYNYATSSVVTAAIGQACDAKREFNTVFKKQDKSLARSMERIMESFLKKNGIN